MVFDSSCLEFKQDFNIYIYLTVPIQSFLNIYVIDCLNPCFVYMEPILKKCTQPRWSVMDVDLP